MRFAQDNLVISDDAVLHECFEAVPHVHFLHASVVDKQDQRKMYKSNPNAPFLEAGVPLLSTAVKPDVARWAACYLGGPQGPVAQQRAAHWHRKCEGIVCSSGAVPAHTPA